MTIDLDWDKARKYGALVDRMEWQDKYTTHKGELGRYGSLPYKMMNGTPLLINIEGACVLVTLLDKLTVSKDDRWHVNKWVEATLGGRTPKEITYRWV